MTEWAIFMAHAWWSIGYLLAVAIGRYQFFPAIGYLLEYHWTRWIPIGSRWKNTRYQSEPKRMTKDEPGGELEGQEIPKAASGQTSAGNQQANRRHAHKTADAKQEALRH